MRGIKVTCVVLVILLSLQPGVNQGYPSVTQQEIIDPFTIHDIIPIWIYFNPACGSEWLNIGFIDNLTSVGTLNLTCQGSVLNWTIDTSLYGRDTSTKGAGSNNIEFSSTGITLGAVSIVGYFPLNGLFVNGSENYYNIRYINSTVTSTITTTTYNTTTTTQTDQTTSITSDTTTVTTITTAPGPVETITTVINGKTVTSVLMDQQTITDTVISRDTVISSVFDVSYPFSGILILALFPLYRFARKRHGTEDHS